MERSFGHRFADIRIHADDGVARRLGAEGFAWGNHIGVASRPVESDPVSDALIAHELAHVLQSGGGAEHDAAERLRRSTQECHAAVRTFVAWVRREHPELGITEANLRVDVKAVFERGQRVLAFEGTSGGTCGGGTPQAVVGESFTRAVNLDPAYALPIVIHELYGHREYGKPELAMQIYNEAIPHMETYGRPRSGAEQDAYGYQETEIYSWMRQYEYFTETRPAHRGMDVPNFDPRKPSSRGSESSSDSSSRMWPSR